MKRAQRGRRRLVCALVAVSVAAGAGGIPVRAASNGLGKLLTALGREHSAAAESSGSGFIVHPAGYILSNNHVVKGATKLEVVLHDGGVHPAKVVETDPYKDLALLKIEAKNLTAAPLGDSDGLEVLDTVIAIGFPLSNVIGTGTASAYEGKLNARRYERIEMLQIDAAVNPGNSGGPLVNGRGEVVGVIVSKLDAKYFLENAGIIPERVNYAVPLREARGLLRVAYPYGEPVVKGGKEIKASEVFRRMRASTVLILNHGSGGAGLADAEVDGGPLENSIGMELVAIPPGTFTMGSPDNEQGRESDEGPQTEVTISRGFWLGKYEVRQREYEAVMGRNPSRFKGDLNRPIEQVTWEAAMSFCRKLTAKERGEGLPEGWEYRLPTEAQWEYACRAGTTTRYSWGESDAESVMKQYCWYEKNAEDGQWTVPHAAQEGTQRVGQKLPNPWGLYDMHGNVWEWCTDWDGSNYSGGRVTDPTGPTTGSYRVIRGGCWDFIARYCRSAFRAGGDPSGTNGSLGFRVALVPVP